ncbi:ABC transporter ATP-binding protein [Nocardioides sp.]|uniref:ABC transporter ATP-binding protein n=1 Tax=Nocardioides sp. TaxID=35761 RepID=UPI002C2D9797|nr:ABC transporter ATP-binding protein [Nocardioides sp.]HSX68860.1 ABC transporter ATP-binding protein [Nocardioides sp.]
MTNALVMKDLWVQRTGRDTLCGVTAELRDGEVVVLAGPNGAGKTTLLSVLAGLCPISSGTVAVAGGAPTSDVARRASGFLPSAPPLYDYLTVSEHLDLMQTLWGIDQPDLVGERIERFDLGSLLDRPAAHLSLGQRQRVGLALITMHEPRILLMDEPFNGLDAESAAILRSEIGVRAEAGCCVVVATHDIAALDRLATRVLFLHEGKLVDDRAVEGAAATQVVDSIQAQRERAAITLSDGSGSPM